MEPIPEGEDTPVAGEGAPEAAAAEPGVDLLAEAVARAGLGREIADALTRWLAAQLVGDRFARLEQAGGGGERGIPLARVFTDLEVSRTPQPGPLDSQRTFVRTMLRLRPRRLATAGEVYDGPRRVLIDADLERNEAEDPRRPQPAGYVLIGGPGQGKSTLGQLLCQLHRAALLAPRTTLVDAPARAALEAFRGPTAQEDLGIPEAPCFPVRLVLAEVAAWLAAQPEAEQTRSDAANADRSPALLRYLAEKIREHAEPAMTAESLGQFLTACPWLLVLDGLDEVPASSDRAPMIAAVRGLLEQLSRAGARGLVVATTRPQGYAGELQDLCPMLSTLYLAPLFKERALAYAGKLAEARFAEPPERRKKVLDRLRLAAAEEATARLMRTPLQVTIMATLVDRIGRAPNARWSLFQDYYRVIYEREMERTIEGSASADSALSELAEILRTYRPYIDRIHANVGLLLQVESERSGGTDALMSADRLADVIDAVLAEDDIEKPKRDALAHQIVRAARDRLVFLVEPQPGRFGFEIRSLQEFMAASALAGKGDALLEARLMQVAKAPSFRNVVLFLASKCFTELSSLRDAFTERICPPLNEDPQDEVARVTLAGSTLALEILEEGSAQNQPKHARRLTELATRLLELPPSENCRRLAEVCTDETEGVLRQALSSQLKRGQSHTRLATWVTLLALVDNGKQWAHELADASWPQRGGERQLIVDSCCHILGDAEKWLANRIAESPGDFPPTFLEMIIEGVIGAPAGGDRSWFDAYREILELSGMKTNVTCGGEISPFYIWVQTVRDSTTFGTLAEMRDPPPAWRGWVAAAEFAWNPSSSTLSAALKRFSESQLEQGIAFWAVPWPLAVFLGSGATSKKLDEVAVQALTGQLGDLPDWITAETRWQADGADLSEILALHEDESPLGRSPADTAFPLAYRGFGYDGSREHGAAQWIPKLLSAFKRATAATVRTCIACWALHLLTHADSDRDSKDRPVLSADDFKDLFGASKFQWFSLPWLAFVSWRPDDSNWAAFLESLGGMTLSDDTMDERCANDILMRTTQVYQAHPERKGLVHLLCAVVLNGGDLPPELPRHMFDPDQFDDPATRAAATLLLLSRGVLPSNDLDAVAQSVAGAWRRQFLGFDQCGSLLERMPFEEALRDRLLIAFRRHFMEKDWLPAAHLSYILQSHLRTRRSGLDDPAVWDRLELPLPRPEQRPASVPPPPSDRGIVQILGIELRDVRLFDNLQISPDSAPDEQGHWIVFLGENGTGKTTLLRSLVLAFTNLSDRTRPVPLPLDAFATPWRRTGAATEGSIQVSLRSHRLKTVIRIDDNGKEKFTQERAEGRPLLFAYGCRRGSALGGAPRKVTYEPGDEIATLFNEGAGLIHAETWLTLRHAGALERPNGPQARLFEAIVAALKKVLPGVDDIKVRDMRVWVSGPAISTPAAKEIPLAALSDGYLTTTGWVLDLIARWIDRAERRNETVEPGFTETMTGLVLVDEIDLYLHPRWQCRVIQDVRRLFPRMSFVVTSHNPLTLLGARAEDIWVLHRDEAGHVRAERGRESPALMTGSQIYSAYFGITRLFPDDLGEKLRRYGYLAGNPVRADAEETEMLRLLDDLRARDVDPGWEPVPREDPPLPTGREEAEA